MSAAFEPRVKELDAESDCSVVELKCNMELLNNFNEVRLLVVQPDGSYSCAKKYLPQEQKEMKLYLQTEAENKFHIF